MHALRIEEDTEEHGEGVETGEGRCCVRLHAEMQDLGCLGYVCISTSTLDARISGVGDFLFMRFLGRGRVW